MIQGVERLGRRPIRRPCLGFYPRRICRVGDCDRFRVFVLGMVLLGVDLFVFLQILRTFKRLLAYLANMRFERRVDCWVGGRLAKGCQTWILGGGSITSEMTGDMISLRTSCTTVLPLTSETEVVGALSADVCVAEVVVEEFGFREGLAAVDPETD
jgi:hypothetical protein